MERINFYELILDNGHETNRCLRQTFLPQKINSSKIKVCRFQWTPSLKSDIFFNRIIIQCFSGFMLFRVKIFFWSRFFRVGVFFGSRFFRVQVFQSPGFLGFRSRVWVQVLEEAKFIDLLT